MGVGKNAMAYVIQTAAEVYGVKGGGKKGFLVLRRSEIRRWLIDDGND